MIPRSDNSFVHREKEKDLGLGENRPIQDGHFKLASSVRIVVSDERVIDNSRQRTPSQITSSRVEMLKVRFRSLIQKSQKQLLYCDGGSEIDGQEEEISVAVSVPETRKKRDESSPTISISRRRRMVEIEKQQKAAREKIESMTRTVDFPNNLEAMSDMAKIMGDSSWYFYGYGGGKRSYRSTR